MVRDAFLMEELIRIDCKGLEKSDYKKIGCKLRVIMSCFLHMEFPLIVCLFIFISGSCLSPYPPLEPSLSIFWFGAFLTLGKGEKRKWEDYDSLYLLFCYLLSYNFPLGGAYYLKLVYSLSPWFLSFLAAVSQIGLQFVP